MEAGHPLATSTPASKPYRSINVLLLWSSEYCSPFWITVRQAQSLKDDFRKGEHGTQIIFYKQLPEYARNVEHANLLSRPGSAID
jgi:antirestriction protein ArdC